MLIKWFSISYLCVRQKLLCFSNTCWVVLCSSLQQEREAHPTQGLICCVCYSHKGGSAQLETHPPTSQEFGAGHRVLR